MKEVESNGKPSRRRLINRACEAIVLKALSKSPEYRYQTAGELAASICAYLEAKPSDASPAKALSRRFLNGLVAALAMGIIGVVFGFVLRQLFSETFYSLSDQVREPRQVVPVKSAESVSFQSRLAKLADGQSIAKTVDGWRISKCEVAFPELASEMIVWRTVLRMATRDTATLLLQSTGGTRVAVELQTRRDGQDQIWLSMQGRKNAFATIVRPSSLGRTIELSLAAFEDRIVLACNREPLMQLHWRSREAWFPVIDARSHDAICVEMACLQPTTRLAEFSVDTAEEEIGAIDYILEHGGVAVSVSSTHPKETVFHVNSLVADTAQDLITTDVIANFARCSRLQTLRLSRISSATSVMSQIGKIKSLTRLEIHHSRLNDDCFQPLAELHLLESLDLWATRIPNPDFRPLQGLADLKYCAVPNVSISDTHLSHLSDVQSLETLYVSGEAVTLDGLQSLRRMGNLHGLALRSAIISGAGVRTLAELTNLWRLDVSDSDLQDDDIPVLLRMTSLERLEVKNTRITAVGLERLKQGLPLCVVIFAGA